MEVTVRPLRTEADYEATLAEIDGPMDAPDPIEAIQVRMEQKRLRRRDLEAMIGSRGRVSEILSRKRALTLPMIRRLAAGLDLDAAILIQEARVDRRRKGRLPRSGPQ